jgi:hypothetical protein
MLLNCTDIHRRTPPHVGKQQPELQPMCPSEALISNRRSAHYEFRYEKPEHGPDTLLGDRTEWFLRRRDRRGVVFGTRAHASSIAVHEVRPVSSPRSSSETWSSSCSGRTVTVRS